MKKIKDTYRILTTPLPAEAAEKFREEFAKPMFAFAFGICSFAIALDYTLQFVEAIDLITL